MGAMPASSGNESSGNKVGLMNHMPLAGGTEASVPSLNALRRPLPDGGQPVFGDLGGGRLPAGLAEYLAHAAENSGEGVDKEVAEALAYALIFQALSFQMLDAEKGRVPRFIDRMAKSVRSFERKLG